MINKFIFKRYKIEYKKKTYYLFIPFEFDQLWIMDWYREGAWIEGNIRCLSYLIAGFCILAFNLYAIVYYPVKKNKNQISLKRMMVITILFLNLPRFLSKIRI